MNKKAIIGLVAAIVILGGAFLFTQKAAAPVPEALAPAATSTTPTSTPTVTPVQPTAGEVSAPAAVPHTAALDTPAMVTSSRNPKITGTAKNVSSVQVIIVNSAGVGIVGGMAVPVVNGKWSFTTSKALVPGSYTVQVGGVDEIITGTLTVQAS